MSELTFSQRVFKWLIAVMNFAVKEAWQNFEWTQPRSERSKK